MQRSHLVRALRRTAVHVTRRRAVVALVSALAFCAGNLVLAAPTPEDPVRVVIETEMGALELEVDASALP